MMNMMTGAVAINGGVGVMEIHQPQVAVSQMAESVAQAAEQVALNAHITLRELKGMIDTVVEKKLPTFKTLMEMNPVAVARTSVNGAKLGMHWLEEADELWVFGNTISEGMATEIEKAHELNKPVRNLPEPGRVVELLLKSISEQYHVPLDDMKAENSNGQQEAAESEENNG